jgi:hypothetical protein
MLFKHMEKSLLIRESELNPQGDTAPPHSTRIVKLCL